jgi:hypothetical protein
MSSRWRRRALIDEGHHCSAYCAPPVHAVCISVQREWYSGAAAGQRILRRMRARVRRDSLGECVLRVQPASELPIWDEHGTPITMWMVFVRNDHYPALLESEP